MNGSVWNKKPSKLAAQIAEAKKDNFPLGTLRLYSGNMANGTFYSHIYVKTGGKKPWAYYATYPSTKADTVLKAGAGIVINGKVAGPATPENLKTFNVEHPFKGVMIPSLIKDGQYSLGAVDDDGNISIDPDGLKELHTAVTASKASAQAQTPATDTPEPIAPVTPPGPPTPLPDLTKTPGAAEPPLPTVKWKTVIPLDATINSHEVQAALNDYIKDQYTADELVTAYPGLQGFLADLASGTDGNWKDALWTALAFKKDKAGAQIYYLGHPDSKGTGDALSGLAKKVMISMGIPIPKEKPKTPEAPAPAPPPAPPPIAAPIPATQAPATPSTAPSANQQQLLNLVQYLKQVGFGDSGKQKDFLQSPAFMSQMNAAFGKDWLSKLITGAAALGIDPSTLEKDIPEQPPAKPVAKKKLSDKVGLSLVKQAAKDIAAGGWASDLVADDPSLKALFQAYGGGAPNDWVDAMAVAGDLVKDPAQAYKQFAKHAKYGPMLTKLAADLGIALPSEATPGLKGAQFVAGAQALGKKAPEFSGALTPQAASTGSDAAEQPAPQDPLPPAQFASLTAPQVPMLSELKKGASAKSLGGAGKKDFYKDSAGNSYLVKLALEKDGSGKAKPFAAIVQEVFSSVALTVRPDHVPIRVDKQADGSLVTIQTFLDRGTPPTIAGIHPANLSHQEKTDVANEHVLDWLMSQHDSHGGNLVRRIDGRVLGVDKEQAFRFFPDDKLDVDYNPNPEEPYYNQFWRAFRDNTMDFDPKVMAGAIAKVESISDVDYQAQIDRYAQSIWPTEATKRTKFLKNALERKKNIRADFEGFLTDLYRKRTSTKKGVFTFNGGWDATGKAPVTAKTKNIVKVKSNEWAVHLGLKEYQYAPTEGPDKGKADLSKIVLKLSKGGGDESKKNLDQFIKDTGLKPVGPVITGSYYHIAVFDKAAYDAVEIEKELPKPIEIEPEDSSALVEVDPHKPAEMNNQDLAHIETAQLGPLGKRYASDSSGIEGQYMRAKRVIDSAGEFSYILQFKMRPSMVSTLTGGTSGNLQFPKMSYQPGPDALSEHVGENVIGMTLKGLKWKVGGSEAFIYKDDHQYTFKNSVFVRVKPKKGESIMDAFGACLDKMRPGLAKDLMRNPTAEEREVAKLARLLWAAAPQQADSNSDYTLDGLKKKLNKLGYTDQDFAHIEERETYSGLQSHVIPGRHKKLGGGKFRFLFNGISDVGAAISVLKLGLLGISERAMMGIHLKGGSVEADITEGAGDQILARPVTENGFSHGLGNHAFGGEYQAIVDPAEADRLDCYMHNSDQFGSCSPYGSHSSAWTGRKSVEKAMESQAKSYSSGAEICFRKGIARSKIMRICCSNQASRGKLIQQAKAAGIVEVNGVSIENFVVIAGTAGEAYEKCVKPVLAKAAAKAGSK